MNNSKHRFLSSFINALLLLCFTAWLAGCGPSYPLGIAEQEWLQMSLEQRTQAYEKQAEFDHAARLKRIEQEQQRQQLLLQQQAQLEQQRQQSSYGERVQCVLDNAQVKLSGKWRDIEKLALDLPLNLPVAFTVHEDRDRSRYSTNGNAFFDGQTVYLCRSMQLNSDCARLIGTRNDFRRSLQQQVASRDFLRGRLRCDLVPPASYWR